MPGRRRDTTKPLRKSGRPVRQSVAAGRRQTAVSAVEQLVQAISTNDIATFKKQLTIDSVNCVGQAGRTLLHTCADNPPNAAAAKLLIDRGCNVHASDTSGVTALHLASKRGALEVAVTLIDHGLAAIDAVSKNGEYPLHLAASHNQVDMAKMLIKRGADPNVRDYEFMAPLHWAAEFFSLQTAEALLEAGADPNVLDMRGKSPLHYAAASGSHKENKSSALIDLLIKHGADASIPDYTHNDPRLPSAYCLAEDNNGVPEIRGVMERHESAARKKKRKATKSAASPPPGKPVSKATLQVPGAN